jgi:hypothetical protein
MMYDKLLNFWPKHNKPGQIDQHLSVTHSFSSGRKQPHPDLRSE